MIGLSYIFSVGIELGTRWIIKKRYLLKIKCGDKNRYQVDNYEKEPT